jgi:hypothetical protein
MFPSPHLKTETDPVSETLFRIPEDIVEKVQKLIDSNSYRRPEISVP